MEQETVILAEGLTKAYRIWKDPSARLKYPLIKALDGVLPHFLTPSKFLEASGQASSYYRDFAALNDVSIEVKKGEAVGIIGRNGMGKSTLLQMIAGTLSPTSGRVRTNGRIAALLELGSGFNPDFTGRENVYMYGGILGLSRSEIEAVFPEIEAFAEIGDFIDQPMKTYSSGMGLRLAFSVMAHVKADILIIDEALAVGDVFFVQKCMRWIRKFRETGTLLFVTHSSADIVALCDRAVWLKDGRAELIGDAKLVAETYLAYYHTQATGGKIVSREKKPKDSLEEDGGSSTVVSGNPSKKAVYDQRLPWLNSTQFRNDIKPVEFNPDKDWYGTGRVRITKVELLEDGGGRSLTHIVGGEIVVLRIVCTAVKELSNPIIGFYLKDRLGQYLFGDNTYLTNLGRKLKVPAGGEVIGEFSFQMPLLPRGKYAIAPAIATGDQDNHVQQCWIHEAIILESINEVTHRGLIALPMNRISTHVKPELVEI
jgi:lipopolysaccharide transport system ATP-binding protein